MNIVQRDLMALARSISLNEIGRQAGVSGGMVGKVLKGKKRPGPKLLEYLRMEALVTYRRKTTLS